MRRHHKKQSLELIGTLFEANAEIKRLFLRQDFSAVLQLLADSQAFILQAGNYIEEVAGEGTHAVTLLTELYEDFYRASVELGEGTLKKAFVKRFRAKLVDIENSIKTELKPDKLEVAFFPYKASMWDSLESIWLAAKDDPQCNAYVVPIPYYDKLSNGALGTLHYEGDLYPDYVPVVDWREYDVETAHPDVIFIHNPYDGDNWVTSVHPDYYSSRLKDLTDLLCYVPYFVVSGNVEETFCMASACVNAHRVIVQSEEVCQTYLRVFKEAFGTRFGAPEDKFLALGSPKFDKAIHSKPEDFPLPDDWRGLIENPDGTRKKCILYNTALSALLHGDEQYLKKIRLVLETFREREDIVLWWRPHPLSKATYASMRPQLLVQYSDIVDGYKNAGFGIYDDTTDLHRAIAWSDAYYGDGSSLVTLFQAVHKPVMIQEIGAAYDEQKEAYCFPLSFYHAGNSIYFTVLQYNALFKMNTNDWTPVYVDSFPEENGYLPLAGNIHYYDCEKDDDVIYFSPYGANEIASYNLSDGSISKMAFPGRDVPNANALNSFWAIKKYGDSLYFSPFSYGAVLKMNLISKEISLQDDFIGKLKAQFAPLEQFKFCYPAYTDDSLWFAASNINAVVRCSTQTLTSTIFRVGKNHYKYNGICYDGRNFWLSPADDGCVLVKWNPVTGITKEFSGFIREEDEPVSFQRAVYCGGFVWLFPRLSKNTYKIHVDTEEITVAEEFGTDTAPLPDRVPKYFAPHVVGDCMFLCRRSDGTFLQYDSLTRSLKKEKPRFSEDILNRFERLIKNSYRLDTIKTGHGFWPENRVNKLEFFLEYIAGEADAKDERIKNKENDAVGSIGAAIYDSIKRTILQ